MEGAAGMKDATERRKLRANDITSKCYGVNQSLSHQATAINTWWPKQFCDICWIHLLEQRIEKDQFKKLNREHQ